MRVLLPILLLAACSAPVEWRRDRAAVLAPIAAAAAQDTIVFFALPGRDLSDRMEQQSLRDPRVLAALADGDFAALWLDGFVDARLYEQWLGGGEGMGVCALDRTGQPFAARPGPQDAPELAAWIRLVAARRADVAAARAAVARSPHDPRACHALGVLQLELGLRVGTEALLVTAGDGGIADAWHRLARLAALEGRLEAAHQWLGRATPSPQAAVTEGYLLFKERSYVDSVVVLQAALRLDGIGDDRQRAVLYLGKSLHEGGREAEAIALLEALVAERTGSTFEGAAMHTLAHIRSPDHGHTH